MSAWRRPRLLRLALALLLAAGVLGVLASPRHRAFYVGWLLGRGEGEGTASVVGRRPARPARGAAPPAPAAPFVRGRRVPLPGADGRIVVPVTDRLPARLPAQGVPPGWELHEFAGRASVELVRSGGRVALRLRSEGTSFALYRDVVVDLRAFPFLTWSWKVVRLPAGGDVRVREADDQAAQVYVVFPRWPAPVATSDVIGYVWDSRAPAGTSLVSTRAANVRLVVVASGPTSLDTWLRVERNVLADYVGLYGRQPPRVGQIALMADTDQTGGTAEALFADLAFAQAAAGIPETPTSMLR